MRELHLHVGLHKTGTTHLQVALKANAAALEAAVAAAGFRRWRVWGETRRLTYPDLPALLRSLKGIGAHNVTHGRPRHLLGKGVWRRLEAAYPRYRGQVVASYVATYVTALR